VDETKRERIYRFIEKLVKEGRQAYVVCPAVEENEEMSELKAAKVYAETLLKKLPGLRIGMVHGRLAGAKKEAVMADFLAGTIDLLVSTTVIEVGVNVPNAALMMVENADRFGLSQLHQLRGRVGRGEHQSYCILFTENKSETTMSRLRAFCATTDGFKIAEEDLKFRGPGDIFGNAQHGVPELKAAGLLWDMRALDKARRVAEMILAEDPALELRKNAAFREKVAALFKAGRNIDIFN
jgi:ATP-dependent DNA helicase RecG